MIDSEAPPTKKRKRSRWGGEDTRTVIPGMPTVIPPNMSEGQQKLYLSKEGEESGWGLGKEAWLGTDL